MRQAPLISVSKQLVKIHHDRLTRILVDELAVQSVSNEPRGVPSVDASAVIFHEQTMFAVILGYPLPRWEVSRQPVVISSSSKNWAISCVFDERGRAGTLLEVSL